MQKHPSSQLAIVTITRNDIAGLRRTAGSIKGQSVRGFKWVVIDGASSDGTEEFLRTCPFVSEFISEPDAGIYDAMQKGLKLAGSKYVLFLNSGDCLYQASSVEMALGHLNGIDVAFFAAEVSSKSASWIRHPRQLASARYSVPAIQQATIYSTSALEKIKWPTAYKICGDYSIAAQLLHTGSTSLTVDVVLSKFELGGVSTLRVVPLAREAWQIQRDQLGIQLPYRLWSAGRRLATGLIVRVIFSLSSPRE